MPAELGTHEAQQEAWEWWFGVVGVGNDDREDRV